MYVNIHPIWCFCDFVWGQNHRVVMFLFLGGGRVTSAMFFVWGPIEMWGVRNFMGLKSPTLANKQVLVWQVVMAVLLLNEVPAISIHGTAQPGARFCLFTFPKTNEYHLKIPIVASNDSFPFELWSRFWGRHSFVFGGVTFFAKHFRYLKWRNPHPYKLYGYGFRKGKPTPNIAKK